MNTFSFPEASFLKVVGSSGLEPPTSRLSGARSNHLSYEPIKLNSVYLFTLAYLVAVLRLGGDDGIRTHDPLLAGQVLSQLSYTPIFRGLSRSLKIEQPKELSTPLVLRFISS